MWTPARLGSSSGPSTRATPPTPRCSVRSVPGSTLRPYEAFSGEQKLGGGRKVVAHRRRRVQAVAPIGELREPHRPEHADDAVEIAERRAVSVAVDDVGNDRA